jgi:hypothetical protein
MLEAIRSLHFTSASIELTKICAGASEDQRIPSTEVRYIEEYSSVAVMYRSYDDLLQVSYNVIRLLVSVIVAVLFGTVYASEGSEDRSDMNSMNSSLLLSSFSL